MTTALRAIDRLCEAAGKAGALALPLLMLTIFVNVVLRYVFDIGMIELEELQWHLNAVAVMLALAWAYRCEDHVRVDMIHARLSPRGRAAVEAAGLVFLFFPFIGLLCWHGWTIFGYSWALKEGSPMPSGLPARYVIKGVMAAGLSLLALQGLSLLARALGTLLRREA
ncbi:TRAP transporter small permease subunit [Mangrovicoccus algicola]|uniref:TRAP transporter small permease protein n=1 Tax=Mangrovicoccus algicola TaxID=2771008 RepID=A0A8J6Z2R2_9RHOB|nr:TRAP transporter small permease subunit [Mangrovicoccus algicola]MBE3640596.1 TRAP transporter small permease subunit [Mangrovicoccus algicola]